MGEAGIATIAARLENLAQLNHGVALPTLVGGGCIVRVGLALNLPPVAQHDQIDTMHKESLGLETVAVPCFYYSCIIQLPPNWAH